MAEVTDDKSYDTLKAETIFVDRNVTCESPRTFEVRGPAAFVHCFFGRYFRAGFPETSCDALVATLRSEMIKSNVNSRTDDQVPRARSYDRLNPSLKSQSGTISLKNGSKLRHGNRLR